MTINGLHFEGAFDLDALTAAIRQLPADAASRDAAIATLKRWEDPLCREPRVEVIERAVVVTWREGVTATELAFLPGGVRITVSAAHGPQIGEALRQQMGVAIRAEAARIREEACEAGGLRNTRTDRAGAPPAEESTAIAREPTTPLRPKSTPDLVVLVCERARCRKKFHWRPRRSRALEPAPRFCPKCRRPS